MRVLILTTTMAPYRVNLFNELGRYCDLTVCFEQQNEASRDTTWFATAGSGFKTIRLKYWDQPLGRVKFDVLNYLKKRDVDLAIAYEYSTVTGILFILACRLKGVPYILNCDGALFEKTSFKDHFKRFLIKGAAACFANGDHARRYFLQFGAREAAIYPHHFTSLYEKDIPLELKGRAEKEHLRKELLPDPVSRVVLTAGRFIRSKRIDVLISAWAAMPSDWLLVIAGSGELEGEYRRQLKELDLENVLLTGHLGPAALSQWYQASDVFVLPTESDVWGLVVNEALAAGLPVITTDKCIAGLELIVDHENGYVLPVGDVGLLVGRLKALLGDERELSRLATNALRSIQGHTYEACAKAHFEVMQQLLGSGSTGPHPPHEQERT